MGNQFLLLFYYSLLMLPPVILILIFTKVDKFPEPLSKIIITILLAYAATSIFSTVKYDILNIPDAWSNNAFINAYFLVAFPEELTKYLVLYFYCTKLDEFNEPMDGIVYGGMAGLGFAMIEAFQYLGSSILVAEKELGGISTKVINPDLGSGFVEIMWTIFSRGLFAIPGHVFDGVIMGTFIGICIFRDVNKYLFFGLALLVPTLFHGTWDYILMAELNSIFFTLLYGVQFAVVTIIFTYFRGLQRTKVFEAERRFN